jgi:hypothetical protein
MLLSEIKYRNFCNSLTMTANEIEKIVRDYELNFPSEISYKIEHEIKPPKFVVSFYDWIVKRKTIPTQDEFWMHYMCVNDLYFDKKNFQGYDFSAFKGRVYRAYPSYVRDLHFVQLLKSKFKKSTVIYSIKLDVEYGIDILIINNNVNYGVNLFTSTERGNDARGWKTNRHLKLDDVIYIDLPIVMGVANFGDFFLYHENEVQMLTEKMLAYATRT